MDWKALAGDIVKAGAPIIGNALGGPMGGTIGSWAGSLIAEALGVEATPDAVNAAIQNAPANAQTDLQAKLAAADQKWQSIAAQVASEADLGKAQVNAIGETMRAELLNGAWYQRAWRPFLMFVWGATWPFQLVAVLHKAYAKDATSLAELSSLLYALSAWNAGPAGVAGVYAWGRTKEKMANYVSLPSPVSAIVKRVTGR